MEVGGVSLSPTRGGCSPAGPALNPKGFSSLYLKSGCCTSDFSVWGFTQC